MRLPLKVVPRSSHDGIAGWLAALGVPREQARIVAGQTSARKVIEITGLSAAEIRDRLTHVVS